MKPHRLAYILDGSACSKWQRDIIEQHAGETVLVLICRNTRPRKIKLSNIAYYAIKAMNMPAALRGAYDAKDALPEDVKYVEFKCRYEGNWQVLPEHVLHVVRDLGITSIVKLGMGLLRVPPQSQLAVPILSFHHGDPSKYRGRPAAFWEIYNQEARLGQVVQILSNKLDGGAVLAQGHTQVIQHSLRETLDRCYSISPIVMAKALHAQKSGAVPSLGGNGMCYTLPSNVQVLMVSCRIWWERIRRFLYLSFFEKKWQVIIVKGTAGWAVKDVLTKEVGEVMRLPDQYVFVADPFFDRSNTDDVLMEGLTKLGGNGVLLRMGTSEHSKIDANSYHLSYPFNFNYRGVRYVLPETVSDADTALYEIENDKLVLKHELTFAGVPERIKDPTLHIVGSACFLFGNRASEGDEVLRLWCAPDPFSDFTEHPCSPICIDPEGGRMGGSVFHDDAGWVRPGQKNDRRYGGGLVLFRIDAIDGGHYKETRVATVVSVDHYGPHHVDFWDGKVAYDRYRERFSLLAGYRRVAGRFGRRFRART